jgi:glycosyltransferase involved in cell wall biosynthesis
MNGKDTELSPKKIRVLHLIDSSFGLYGAEKVILMLSGEMKKSSGYEPVVGCIVQSKSQDVALFDAARREGIEAYKLKMNNKIIFFDLIGIARFLRNNNIGLIHSHGYKPTVFGYLLSNFTGIPIMVTCHLWYTRLNSTIRYKFMTYLEKFVFRYIPYIVTVSDPLRDYLISLRIPFDKVYVINNGIDIDVVEAERRGKSTIEASDDAKFIIVNVARLSEQKAHENIIRAATSLKERKRQFIIQLVGEGYLRPRLERLIAENGLEDEVKLLGFKDNIGEILRCADIFILPSHDEGLPMSLLEAISYKTPVIVTPVGEIPNIIEHGVNGIIVPKNDAAALADAIEWSITNRENLKEMAAQAYSVLITKYSSKIMKKKYENIYYSLLNTNKKYLIEN